MKKAQISTEFLMTVGLVGLILIFMLFISFEKNNETRKLKYDLDNTISCQKMASILGYLFLSSEGTELTMNLRQRLVTNGTSITVMALNQSSAYFGQSCRFQGFIPEYDITGNIRILKSGGGISITGI